MVEFPFLVSTRLNFYTVCLADPPKLICLKGNDSNPDNFIIMEVDGKTLSAHLFCDVMVEGRIIKVKSDSLPNDVPPLELKFELIEQIPCELKWGVQSAQSQKIYQGLTKKTILIQGPQNQKGNNVKHAQLKKSILVSTDGITSQEVIEGSSMIVSGTWVEIKANQSAGDYSLTGKYTLLK